jgi:hypothetical protein
MSSSGGSLEKMGRCNDGAFSATTVVEHFGKGNLRVHDAGFCRPLKPDASLPLIGSHASSFLKHASIHILRLGNAFGRSPHPTRRTLLVLADTNAFGKAET